MATAFERGDCTLFPNLLLILSLTCLSSLTQAFSQPSDKSHQERASD